MDQGHEEWRPVVGYEGIYEVSCTGNVRRARDCKLRKAGSPRKTQVSPAGYLTVHLWKDGKVQSCPVHRLVAEAFLGPRPVGLHINHKDCNKRNPHVSNLEYVTPRENALHAKMMKRYRHTGIKGPANAMTKLTETDVVYIRRAYEPDRVLAQRFGVSKATISKIRKRTLWAHVPESDQDRVLRQPGRKSIRITTPAGQVMIPVPTSEEHTQRKTRQSTLF